MADDLKEAVHLLSRDLNKYRRSRPIPSGPTLTACATSYNGYSFLSSFCNLRGGSVSYSRSVGKRSSHTAVFMKFRSNTTAGTSGKLSFLRSAVLTTIPCG